MDNQGLFEALRPKQNQFVHDHIGSNYRPKSTVNIKNSKRQNFMEEDLIIQRPPSQSSMSTKSNKRIVFLGRNGKKKEKLDIDMKIQGSEVTKQPIYYQTPAQQSMGSPRTLSQSLFYGKKQLSQINTLQNFEDAKGLYRSIVLNKQLSQPIFPLHNQENMRNSQENFRAPILSGDNYMKEKFYATKSRNLQDAYSNNDDDQSEQCLPEIDPFFLLDNISINDPLWKQILPDHLIDQAFIERLVEDNPEYFYHHLGFCACFKCKCGRCRCDVSKMVKLKINGPQMSIYMKDFIEKKDLDLNNIQTLNQTNYDTRFLDQKTIDKITNNQINYESKKPYKIERHRTNPSQGQIGNLSNLTNYKQTFGNWGVDDYGIIKRVQHVSTSEEIPFLGKTNYQETFCSNNKIKSETYHYQKNGLSPLPTGPFIGITTNQKAFTPYKIHQSKSPEPENMKKQYRTPVYEGQYTSTFSRDFRGEKDEICPAQDHKKQWKQKLIQKYNFVRELKDQQKYLLTK